MRKRSEMEAGGRPGGQLTAVNLHQSVDAVKLVPLERQEQGQENGQEKAQLSTQRDPGRAASSLETAPCPLGCEAQLQLYHSRKRAKRLQPGEASCSAPFCGCWLSRLGNTTACTDLTSMLAYLLPCCMTVCTAQTPLRTLKTDISK